MRFYSILPAPLILFFLLTSCNTPQIDNRKNETNLTSTHIIKDSFILKPSQNEVDEPSNDYLTKNLQPIRQNFKRINSITNWTKVKKMDLWETTEGGEVHFYYTDKTLEKIICKQYGETFQNLSEYYLMDGKISFILEKSYKYNRPIYYDSASMLNNNDNEIFDFEKSEVTEDRSYFENNTLLHQINNQDCGSPFEKGYLLREQVRLLKDFDALIKLSIKKEY